MAFTVARIKFEWQFVSDDPGAFVAISVFGPAGLGSEDPSAIPSFEPGTDGPNVIASNLSKVCCKIHQE